LPDSVPGEPGSAGEADAGCIVASAPRVVRMAAAPVAARRRRTFVFMERTMAEPYGAGLSHG
jgi:hypothetical protein